VVRVSETPAEYPADAEGDQASLTGFADDQTQLGESEEKPADWTELPEDEQGACAHVRDDDLPCWECFDGDGEGSA